MPQVPDGRSDGSTVGGEMSAHLDLSAEHLGTVRPDTDLRNDFVW